MLGLNPLRKREDTPDRIWVHEVFETIQGEGPSAGLPAVFIRIGGCTLQCFYCDTEFDSTEQDDQAYLTPATLHQAVEKIHLPPGLVVITGGEPLRFNLTHVVRRLQTHGYDVEIETAGQFYWSWIADFAVRGGRIICSPKTDKVAEQLKPYIHAYKYILRTGECSKDDGLPMFSTQSPGVVQKLARPHPGFKGQVYVQPCEINGWNSKETAQHLRATILIAQRFNYRLSLQTHKIIGLP